MINLIHRIKFFLGWNLRLLKPTQFKGEYIYNKDKKEIKEEWADDFPWYKEGEKNNKTNYGEPNLPKRGVWTVVAKLKQASKKTWPAVWSLNIVHNIAAEEIDFELMKSPSLKRECLYIGTYINHNNSYYHDPCGKFVIKHWGKRFINKKLIRSLKRSFHSYSIEITDKKVKWYIDGHCLAEQKLKIIFPQFFVLTNINYQCATIRK